MAGFPVLVPAPAGALPNGLDVNCNPEPGEANTAICVISGCPRVHGDYVVDAANRDVPFDRFTVEQIAGQPATPFAEFAAKASAAWSR